MENLLNCDGRRFRAKIDGVECEGRIQVYRGNVLLCQDAIRGCPFNNDLGYRYSWTVKSGTEDDLRNEKVSDFCLVVMTAAEIEANKDWRVGDKVTDGDRVWEVIFRSGELVVCKKDPGRATANHTCDELYGYGFRLVADPTPEDETVELTMDEIAAKVGVPVDKLRIKKEEAK